MTSLRMIILCISGTTLEQSNLDPEHSKLRDVFILGLSPISYKELPFQISMILAIFAGLRSRTEMYLDNLQLFFRARGSGGCSLP